MERHYGASMADIATYNANLSPSSNPNLSHHLTDSSLTPIISSSSSPAQSQALTALTSTALTAYECASRLGLGTPQRMMIESSSGPLLFRSFLTPPSPDQSRSQSIVEAARSTHRPLSSPTDSEGDDDNQNEDEEVSGNVSEATQVEEETETKKNVPPLLIATVVARTADSAAEARKAAHRLEKVGREFQREWVAQKQKELDGIGIREDGEGGDG